MSQTIRLTYEPGLTPTLFLFDLEGAAVGEVGGYALTEAVVGLYEVDTVDDAVSGDDLLAVLQVGGENESTGWVNIPGAADSVSVVRSAHSESTTATEVSDRLEREGGPLETLVGKFAGITLVSSWLRAMFRKDDASAVAISEINTGGGTYDETTDSLEAIRDQVNTVAPLTGPNTITITVTNVANDNPIEGALVRCSKEGSSESKRTNASGVVTFDVVDATWALSVDAENFTGQSDSSFVVPDETTKSFELVSSEVSPSADPDTSNGTLRVIDQYGSGIANESISIRIIGKEFAGSSYTKNIERTHTTNSSGFIPLTLLRASAFADGAGVYEAEVGTGRGRTKFRFAAPSGADFTITESV